MSTVSLYQEVILDHNRKPRNYGTVENASHQAEGHNPLCGDHLSITLNLSNQCIDSIAFQGESCAICKASASMMTVSVIGKMYGDVETLVKEFRDMVMGNLNINDSHHLGRLTIFSGIRDLPTRVKCAILPWHTLHAALNSITNISTETKNDPMHTMISKIG
ncbi:MAG: SUF system NifU family Fe-S cluster assembly protein [Nitrosomonadaceae bacterium]|nr:SUF system NifU family Fe-S cluster assembly protein [Nitrosospira sp.]MSQ05304.1 SUF system NifU family Fe-S cluster assembly protein [Nitrosomonadaceae bacterium]